MPTVNGNGKEFDYTPEGIEAAKLYQKQRLQRPPSELGFRPLPSQTPSSSPVVSAALEGLGNFAGQRAADTFGAPADTASFIARQVGVPVPENVIGGSQSIIEAANAIRSLAENFAAQNVPDPIKQAVRAIVDAAAFPVNVITEALEMLSGGVNTLSAAEMGQGAAAGAGIGAPGSALPAQALPAQALPAQAPLAQAPLAQAPGMGSPLVGMRGGGMIGFRPLRMDDGGSVDREKEFQLYSEAWRIVHGEDPPERVRRWYMDPSTSPGVIEGATIELQEQARMLQRQNFEDFLESPEGIEDQQEGTMEIMGTPDPTFTGSPIQPDIEAMGREGFYGSIGGAGYGVELGNELGDEIPIPRRKPIPQGMAHGGMPRGTVAGERESLGYLTARQAGETMRGLTNGQSARRNYGGIHSLYNRYR